MADIWTISVDGARPEIGILVWVTCEDERVVLARFDGDVFYDALSSAVLPNVVAFSDVYDSAPKPDKQAIKLAEKDAEEKAEAAAAEAEAAEAAEAAADKHAKAPSKTTK